MKRRCRAVFCDTSGGESNTPDNQQRTTRQPERKTQRVVAFLIVLTAVIFAAVSPIHAQMDVLPPFLDESKQPPFAAPESSADFLQIEPSKPIENKIFPYKNRPLRDPFWTVGYFPTKWGEELKPKKKMSSASEWRIPTSQITVSGVSRMGSRVMAIINGELKQVGDIVEVSYLGKIFQWKVSEIQPDGNVRFDRSQVVSDTPR